MRKFWDWVELLLQFCSADLLLGWQCDIATHQRLDVGRIGFVKNLVVEVRSVLALLVEAACVLRWILEGSNNRGRGGCRSNENHSVKEATYSY